MKTMRHGRRIAGSVYGLLCLAGQILCGPAPLAAREIGWEAEGRHGVVAAGKAEAVEAGLSILEKGGNAADAAVAAILALAISDYGMFGIGAEAPFMIYDARTARVRVISGVGGAPLDPKSIAWYEENGIPRKGGIRAAPVPAAVAVCFRALESFGTMRFETVAEPALGLLGSGGEEWYDELAATLRRLVETERETAGSREEKLRAARDRFYKGDIADDLVAWYVEQGGFLRKEDLAAHVAAIEDPVTVDYRGYTVCKCGPWTQGPYLLQTLRLLETFDLKAMGHLSADYIHTCIEALKLALADRDEHYGDPNFAGVPLSRLLSGEYTRIRAALIDPGKASREIRPGDPIGLRSVKGPGLYRPAEGGTTTCCVADRWGNLVAATPSGNPPYIHPPGGKTGVTHGNRLRSLNTAKGHPNRIEPGKRPRITLTPTIVLRAGKPVLAISVAGGDLQDQTTLNLLLDFVEFGRMPREAVRLPRFGTGHHQNSFDPAADRAAAFGTHGSVLLSEAVAEDVVKRLEERGHVVAKSAKPLGYPVMILLDTGSGMMRAAGDPDAGRRAGAAKPPLR